MMTREGGRGGRRDSYLRRSMSDGSLYIPGTEGEGEGGREDEEEEEEEEEEEQGGVELEVEEEEEGKEGGVGGGLVRMTATTTSSSSSSSSRSMNIISAADSCLSSLPSSPPSSLPSSFSSSACPLKAVTTTPDLLGVIMHFLLVGDTLPSLPPFPPTSTTTTTTTTIIPVPPSLPPSFPPSESTTRHDRLALSSLSLVCREWRDTARHSRFWKPIVKNVFPVAYIQKEEEEEEAAAVAARKREEEGRRQGGRGWWRRGGRGRLQQHSPSFSSYSSSSSSSSSSRPPFLPSYFALLREQGRAVLYRQLLLEGALPPALSLLLQFEVVDMMDGLRLLSCSGPFRVVPIEGTIMLRLTGTCFPPSLPPSSLARAPSAWCRSRERFCCGLLVRPSLPLSLPVPPSLPSSLIPLLLGALPRGADRRHDSLAVE